MSMRYWAYFAAKVILVGGILYGSLGLLNPLAPHDPDPFSMKPVQSSSNLPRVPILRTYREIPTAAQRNSGARVLEGKIGDTAEPEIQVEIAPPSGTKTAGAAKSPEEKEKEERAIAPLSYGNEYLAINLALMIWFLFGAGMLYFVVYDQRYRCRVCLRRLRMPVETGSRGFMLQLGRPRTEYICPYGHGTLKQEEFQTSGLENPEWTAHSGDMWDELYAASKQDRDEQ